MKILVAEDNLFYRRTLSATLAEWHYEVVTAADGEEAWEALQEKGGPRLAIVDWMMPRLDGLELCRRVRGSGAVPPSYIILLTSKEGKENVVAALNAGADDFISKPFDRMELQARLRVGVRIVGLQEKLACKVDGLEAALSQAQKMEAVGRLAGGVAHDFNNLLLLVSGGVDLLEADAGLLPRHREFTHIIQAAAERGASLTRQLLAFSRKQVMLPDILNINNIVTNAQKLLSRLIGEDIELRTRLAATIGMIKADPGQIEQVIMNLVVNARDAMPFGGTITLETQGVEISEADAASPATFRPGPYVLLSVTDSGCGMDAETKSHLFEPFFTTKGPGKGTGLGLATVYGIVRQSGGFIQVDSEPGAGTTFRIYLPHTEEKQDAPAAVAWQRDAAAGGETVLLVEDDEQVRKMLRRTLEASLYRVLEAGDGAEALRIHDEWTKPIDLLLTDVVMPHMNGTQVAERLTQARPNLKVLLMSGHTDDSSLHGLAVKSGKPFLQKPFTSASLHRKIRELLGRKAP